MESDNLHRIRHIKPWQTGHYKAKLDFHQTSITLLLHASKVHFHKCKKELNSIRSHQHSQILGLVQEQDQLQICLEFKTEN